MNEQRKLDHYAMMAKKQSDEPSFENKKIHQVQEKIKKALAEDQVMYLAPAEDLHFYGAEEGFVLYFPDLSLPYFYYEDVQDARRDYNKLVKLREFYKHEKHLSRIESLADGVLTQLSKLSSAVANYEQFTGDAYYAYLGEFGRGEHEEITRKFRDIRNSAMENIEDFYPEEL